MNKLFLKYNSKNIISKILIFLIPAFIILLIYAVFWVSGYIDSLSRISGTLDNAARYKMPVLSIWGDEDDFYSYENGLLIPGKAYDDYVANGGKEEPNAFVPANYNDIDKRINVKTILYNPDGSIIFNEKAKLGIGGNSSRRYDLKPFVLDYENKVSIDFDMSSNNRTLSSPSSFKRLKTRNCGVDYYGTMLRNALVSQLAIEAGFCDTPPVQPVLIYINGKYYGIEDLQPVYTKGYVSDCFGVNQDKIEIVSGGESDILSAMGYDDSYPIDACDEGFRNEFESKVDIHQLLYYYAFELYTENGDWPLNNVRVWRYTGKYDKDNKYTDGKFRFMLYDFDSTFEGYEANEDPFLILFYASSVEDGSVQTGELWDLMSQLIKYEPYKQELAADIIELSNIHLSSENMLSVLDYWDSMVGWEMPYQSLCCEYEATRGYAMAHAEKTQQLKDILSRRREEVFSFLNSYLGGKELYNITISSENDSDIISCGTLSCYGDRQYNLTLCPQYDEKITAICGVGREFDHFVINGENVFDDTIIINEYSPYLVNDSIDLVLVSKPAGNDSCKIIMDEVSNDNIMDYIYLKNISSTDINLKDYYLSDNEELSLKFNLGDIILAPNDRIKIVCKNTPLEGTVRTNFNLRSGEILSLSKYVDGEIIICDKILLPKMQSNESYYRYNNSQEWRFLNITTR